MKITLDKEKKFVLLMSILQIGGEGTKKQVLDNIDFNSYLNFDESDLELKHNRNELHWRNDLAFVRKKLVSENYIDDSIKNNWKITNEGIEYLEQLCAEIVKIDVNVFKKLTQASKDRAVMYFGQFSKQEDLSSAKEEIASTLNKTEEEYLIKVRIGQGIFKSKLLELHSRCKICGMSERSLLIASHIKPWRDCNSNERLDSNNGFLLCPNHDALFDKGYISFDDNGKILISNAVKDREYKILGIEKNIKIPLNEGQKYYLKWHRGNVFNKYNFRRNN